VLGSGKKQVACSKVTGADAVLYPVIERYSTSYLVVGSSTNVRIRARLVDARTGKMLWEGFGRVSMITNQGAPVDPLTMAVGNWLAAKMLGSQKPTRQATGAANNALITGHTAPGVSASAAIPLGPRHPDFGR